MFRKYVPFLGMPVLASCAFFWAADSASAWPLGSPVYYHGPADPYPPSVYGYNLDDLHPGYYGGGRYREYYNYGRGYGLANFPDSLPASPYVYPYGDRARLRWTHSPSPAAPVDPSAVPTPAREPVAYLEVQVPADAQIWLEGAKTKQTGTSRLFVSPSLNAGEEYTYEVRVRWTQDGREVEQVQQVAVHAGDRLHLTFPATPKPEPLPAPSADPSESGQ
ncbi:MAG TPA: TIGR03000 domain-containing protein [Gemmataceae bacterium]|jgi:uncharacterized protein (TIGR03000 family)|nr:TIGR03000 domain-containing protein [Gemmataceae bacterium]